jgi:hypothetical protein
VAVIEFEQKGFLAKYRQEDQEHQEGEEILSWRPWRYLAYLARKLFLSPESGAAGGGKLESMILTRRKLASAILNSAAATALAQTQPSPPATPDEELKAARDRIRATSETLAKQPVPIETEPALQFKA